MSSKLFGSKTLGLLRAGPFRRYIIGSLISDSGTWMQMMAQGWVMSTLTNRAILLGLISFSAGLPTISLTPFGGSAADRLDKRKILIATQIAQIAFALGLGWLVLTNRIQIWHVIIFAGLLGISIAFEMPAISALVPELVKRDEIAAAVALDRSVFHGSRLIGPSLAGYFVAWWGEASAFFTNAISFVALIAALKSHHSFSYRPDRLKHYFCFSSHLGNAAPLCAQHSSPRSKKHGNAYGSVGHGCLSRFDWVAQRSARTPIEIHGRKCGRHCRRSFSHVAFEWLFAYRVRHGDNRRRALDELRSRQHDRAGACASPPARPCLRGVRHELFRVDAGRRSNRARFLRFDRNTNDARRCIGDLWNRRAYCFEHGRTSCVRSPDFSRVGNVGDRAGRLRTRQAIHDCFFHLLELRTPHCWRRDAARNPGHAWV